PRQLDDTIPKELDRICLKALGKRASDRYSTAIDLAEDLRHWQSVSSEILIPNLPVTSPVIDFPPSCSGTTLTADSLSGGSLIQVVPKGLRSFEAEDADFFLDLLPGPSGRDGLPESIQFWKTRLEETDPDKTFRVGLIYGPSGCAKSDEPNVELVRALRQCDGQHLQCILLVRDDFWMAITRFMRELEVPLLENRNSMPVDLFSPRHAHKVLVAFGRAFGAIPKSEPGALATGANEQDRFLNQAVEGLAREGKIIPVHLALFAEMVKGKPWTSNTLKEVGGTQGIGVTFLEETFNASTAPPQHRIHQKSARAVLQALLPEPGATLKGQWKSYHQLLEASGYARQPREFEELLRILDTELR